VRKSCSAGLAATVSPGPWAISPAPGLPWIVSLLVILGEFFGALMLIAGLGTRFAAASLALIMLGAAWELRGNGFFMNWFGTQKGEGIELFVLAIGIAIALMFLGGGKWSIDATLQS